MIPRPSVPGREHYRPELPRPGVPGRGHYRPRFQARLPTGWHRRRLLLLSNIYSTDNVVLFWQPPSYFSKWSPSSFFVDGVPYSCVEQFMMAEKARLFKKTIGLWGSSCRCPIQAHTNALVEACVTLTPLFRTERSKMPCYLATTPNSRRIPP